AEEADLHRAGAPGAAVPRVPRRAHPLVRPLAQADRHRDHVRAAGPLLAHGQQRVAHRRRLAAAGDRGDEVLPRRLGDAEHPRPAAEVGAAARQPDVFTQMPLTKTTKIERLRYLTDPLPHDLTVVGPISLTLYAEIDQPDTNWIVILKDVGPDVSVRTAREGERDLPPDLKERELTRGWLKASYRALD